jgi:hypothetical protein
MRRLIKPISTLLLVAIPMAVVDPALAETRTARNGEAVIEYQIDGKGPAVLMIASLGRPASDFDELSGSLVAAGYSTIRPQPRGIGGSTGPMNGLSLSDLAADAMAAADDGLIIVIGHDFGQRVARMWRRSTRIGSRVWSCSELAARFRCAQGPAKPWGRCLTPPCRQTNTWTRCASLSSLRAMILRSGATAGILLSHECRPLP